MNIVYSAVLASAFIALPAKAENLWNEWYLVSKNGSGISYFEEVAEGRPKEREKSITQRWVEKIGERSELYIGSVAGEARLAPVAFFVERKGNKPYKIDGRAKKKKLDITFKPAFPGSTKSSESIELDSETYFSNFIPLLISRRLTGGKKTFSFQAVVEDAGDMNVELKSGRVEITATEKKIGSEICRKAMVNIGGPSQEWWITKKGKVCLVDFPDSGTKLELTTEKEAKKALGEGI